MKKTRDKMTPDKAVSHKTVPRMPYGKYQGQAVADVPLSYLRWFLKNGKASGPVMDTIAVRAAPSLLKSLEKELARPTDGLSPLEMKIREVAQKLADRIKESAGTHPSMHH